MMIGPEEYRSLHLHDSYEELIQERNTLVSLMNEFEETQYEEVEELVNPDPETVYEMNIKYLKVVLDLMERARNIKFMVDDLFDHLAEKEDGFESTFALLAKECGYDDLPEEDLEDGSLLFYETAPQFGFKFEVEPAFTGLVYTVRFALKK